VERLPGLGCHAEVQRGEVGVIGGVAINSADDERNPPETGVEVEAMKHVMNGKLYLIPASDQTSGHGTVGNARFYKQQLQEFLQMVPRQAM
jgi:homoserine O-acetyltransferase/O-succinyltransferase